MAKKLPKVSEMLAKQRLREKRQRETREKSNARRRALREAGKKAKAERDAIVAKERADAARWARLRKDGEELRMEQIQESARRLEQGVNALLAEKASGVMADAVKASQELGGETLSPEGAQRLLDEIRNVGDGDPGDETERDFPNTTAPDPAVRFPSMLDFDADTPPVFIAYVKVVADAFACNPEEIVSPYLAAAMKTATLEDLFNAYVQDQKRKAAQSNSRFRNEAAERLEAMMQSEQTIQDRFAKSRTERVSELQQTVAQFFGRA